LRITGVTPYLLRGQETYGAHAGRDEATDQGDWLLLVRVSTDEGLEGWSDVETLAPVAARVIAGDGMGAMGFHTISAELVGKDPLEVERLWEELYLATVYYGRRGVVMHCISAVDNCLWSIRAQAAGVDLSTALGGRRRDRLPAYASTLFRETPEENAAAAGRYAGMGFRAVKFGWGGFGIDPALDRDNLAAVRDALGPQRAMMTDPGWYIVDGGRPRLRTDTETRRMLSVLADFDPYWVEDFLHPERFDDYARFKEEFPRLRFAAGEQQSTRWDFDRLIAEARIDVLQPDLSRCGGLTVASAVAGSARDAGVEVVTHSWLTDLLHAHSLHFLATLDDAHWVEFNVAQSALSRGVVTARMSLGEDGTVAVPDGVGLGVDVDRDFVLRTQVALTH
jgi:L-alanine-DL-glutamate epimerase-like enolase superfamily enzyme